MSDSKFLPARNSAVSGTASRKQKRALVTRRQLMRSARSVFARHGFEHARMEDIAAAAGKTRGALYANFKDKEDLFFAIFEEDIDRDMERIHHLLLHPRTAAQRIDALAGFLAELSNDRQRTLLNLEFKAYAIRHPRKCKRLADLHAVMRLRCSLPEIDECLPAFDRQSTKQKRSGSLAIGAILDGLALNRLFDPGALDDSHVAHYLTLCLKEALRLPGPK
jgi:AcrR family transcriptional regulator